jgi:hypothetical protein
MTWKDCAYGNPSCSTAAATWALAIFAVASLVAAAEALFWTKSLFGIEVLPRLGQTKCTKRSPGHPSDVDVFVLSDRVILIGRRPVGFNHSKWQEEYNSIEIAFTNLGRTALTNVHVAMVVNGDPERHDVDLANIVRDKETHLTVYTSREIGDVNVCWSDAKQNGLPIAFFPQNPVTEEAVYALDKDTAKDEPLPGMTPGE